MGHLSPCQVICVCSSSFTGHLPPEVLQRQLHHPLRKPPPFGDIDGSTSAPQALHLASSPFISILVMSLSFSPCPHRHLVPRLTSSLLLIFVKSVLPARQIRHYPPHNCLPSCVRCCSPIVLRDDLALPRRGASACACPG